MSTIEYAMQALVLLLLAVAIPYSIRLERGLAALRRDRGAMDGSAQGLSEAASTAEATLRRLRGTAEESLRQIDDRAIAAEKLRDDLRYLIERADSLADRLDGLVRQARPLASEAPAVPAPRAVPSAAAPEPEEAPPRSQAERDLIRALRLAR